MEIFSRRRAWVVLVCLEALSLNACETPSSLGAAPSLLPARSEKRTLGTSPSAAHTFQVVGRGPIFLIGQDLGSPVVLHVELAGAGVSYRNDLRISGEPEYHLRSEAFSFEELRQGLRSSFRAELFRGRIGKEGVSIEKGFGVHLQRSIYLRSGPPGPEIVGQRPWILLFGGRNEMFALDLSGPQERRLLGVRVRRGALTEAEADALRLGALATLLEESSGRMQVNVQPGKDAYQAQLEILTDLTPR